MSYKKGIKAAWAVGGKPGWFESFEEELSAFLAKQPEVSWCREHERSVCTVGGAPFDHCAIDHDAMSENACHVVKARIVIENDEITERLQATVDTYVELYSVTEAEAWEILRGQMTGEQDPIRMGD